MKFTVTNCLAIGVSGSQPIILGFTVLFSYILRYWLLSFKFLFCFKKSQLWQHIPIISHLKMVVQTLRKKGKVLTKGKKIKSIYETALGSSHWDNVVSVGIFFLASAT